MTMTTSISRIALPRRLSAVAADIKLHHSVFALPWAILAAVLAGARRPGGIRAGQLALIVICMVTARTVAMLANRLLDAKLDAANPRTARRAIPSGKITPAFALVVLIASAILFIVATAGFELFYFNPWPAMLAIPVLAFVCAYPLLKRFTRLCHYYLGAALALAPLCAWIAIAGTLALPPILMAVAVLLWTAGFDILYACQDYDCDVAAGLYSVPAKLGVGRALWVARFTHLACIGCIVALAVSTPELGRWFEIATALAAVLIVIEHAMVSAKDLSRLTLAFFTLNGVISLMLGTAGIVDILRCH